MNSVKGSKFVMISSWIVVSLWVVLIFTFSVQTAEQSAGLSSKVTEIIVKAASWVTPIDSDEKAIQARVKQIHNLVRKCAHGGLYFVLGLLVIYSFIQTGEKGLKTYVYAVLFCMVYAVTDEMHQTLVAGRSGQVSDIVIDTVGAMVGISLWWAYGIVRGDGTQRQ